MKNLEVISINCGIRNLLLIDGKIKSNGQDMEWYLEFNCTETSFQIFSE